jgi:hypothetical protein
MDLSEADDQTDAGRGRGNGNGNGNGDGELDSVGNSISG